MFVLSDTPSIANQFLAELRNVETQKDSMRFRKNLERIGEVLAYEISKTFTYADQSVETPLAVTQMKIPTELPVIFSVLRAAVPFSQGFLNVFDAAACGFIGAVRVEGAAEINIDLNYHAAPSVTGKTIIITDPMLATGKSLIAAIKKITSLGNPAHIHIASVVAAPEGIQHIKEHLTLPYSLWVGAIDERLNDKFYIVPGLGDAGDLAFGSKL